MSAASPDDRRPADIEIGAAARARRIRFREKPETRVEFAGQPEVESDSHTERENLPEEVRPGETYRDVRVRWTAGARISDEAVRELEGEIAARGRSKGADRARRADG